MKIGRQDADPDWLENIFNPAMKKARENHKGIFAICAKCGKFKNRGLDKCRCKRVWR